MFTNRNAEGDEKFFVLDVCPEFFFEPDSSVVLAPGRVCDKCGESIGKLRWQAPLQGSLVFDRKPYDVASSIGGSFVILSAKAIAAMDASGIQGAQERIPIHLLPNDGPVVKLDYYMAEVAHWSAEVDPVASGFKWREEPTCPECRIADILLGYDRVAVVKNSWNGDDLFTLRGLMSVVVVSEKFVEVCRKFRLSVCSLVPTEQYWRPVIGL
ncbi:imm11 family protein [Bryobacter aggregatus]|uniref:imm11 family protein n=1 Tax=Bryobacter aggregatus TaxID=360054 RepID=UPI0004E18775|nr:DUF1629 domain-containing protein [Bryobacter aggregatus]